MHNHNGTVTIFNCTPYSVELTLNGVEIESPLPPMTDAPQSLPPFPRIDQDNVKGDGAFGTNNTLATRADDMPNITYRIPMSANDYPLGENLVVYIFNRGAFLSYQGKAFPLNPA
jgi:hypothetical protein